MPAKATMIAVKGRPLAEIETWIFDLDNTLYPASCRLFDQIHARMTQFIGDRLDLSPEAALLLQKTYFCEHGTTLRGLMTSTGSTRTISFPSSRDRPRLRTRRPRSR